MPYCSGCGSRYQEGDTVCKSCGFELVYDVDPKSAGKHPAGAAKDKLPPVGERKTTRPRRSKKPNTLEKTISSGPDQEMKGVVEPKCQTVTNVPIPASESRCLQAEVISCPAAYNDIHLGKGIIKPKSIEVGLDGFHFKYEEPPFSGKKAEPMLKERSVEYRISNSDCEWQSPGEPLTSNEGLNPLLAETGNNIVEKNIPRVVLTETDDPTKVGDQFEIDSQHEPVGLKWEEPQPQQEEPNPVEVDSTVGDDATTQTPDTPENSVIPSDRETPGPGVSDVESPSGNPESCELNESIDLHDQSGRIPTEINEVAEDIESAPPILTSDTPPAIEVEVTPEGETVPEPMSLTPIEADASEEPEEKQSKILWQGQQSWFGIPFPCFYQLTESVLMVVDPNGRLTEFEVGAIRRVTLRQSWFAKVLGIGDLILEFHDPAVFRQVLTGIANPNKAKSILEGLITSRV